MSTEIRVIAYQGHRGYSLDEKIAIAESIGFVWTLDKFINDLNKDGGVNINDYCFDYYIVDKENEQL